LPNILLTGSKFDLESALKRTGFIEDEDRKELIEPNEEEDDMAASMIGDMKDRKEKEEIVKISRTSAHSVEKEELVKKILSQKEYEAVIIFASTKEKVKSLFKVLRKQFDVEAFHSDLEQVEREKIMASFKNRAVKILVGTDIISRGIDVVGIELIINYDTPSDPEDYVHRVGRTARADKEGEAITFVNPKDQYKFVRIEKLIGMHVTQNPLPQGMEAGPTYSGEAKKEGGNFKSGNKSNFKKREGDKPKNKPQHSKRTENPRPASSSTTPASAQPTKSTPKTEGKFGERKNVIDPE
jgi:superfamily II DNA/RNA helicase